MSNSADLYAGQSNGFEAALDAARSAGLHYVLDISPGLRRRRAGKGFYYTDLQGRVVREPGTLARIRSLAIPPAWRDVWICPHSAGHLQATGLDSRGRKQYRYHPKWREVRDSVKYERMIAFGEALPTIRERTAEQLSLRGMPREKVLAGVVRLLETTRIRVGNDSYRRENRSFGLTTLRNRHVKVEGSRMTFTFRGKGGKQHCVQVMDRRLARVVQRSLEIPGQELFSYLEEDGGRKVVESGDVNSYLREISGGDFTAKDFRTWSGSVLMFGHLRRLEPAGSKSQCGQQVASACSEVAKELGNTPAICRKSYIHPVVVEGYMQGALPPPPAADTGMVASSEQGLSEDEEALLAFLRERQSSA